MPEFKKELELKIDITPKELAKLFASMHSEEQAEFFNQVAEEVAKWHVPFIFQLAEVERNNILTVQGRKVIEEIGQFSQPF